MLTNETIALLHDTGEELENAIEKFPPFNSAHEGFAVIAEELDELWESVRANKGGTRVTLNATEMRSEAIQVAAMALRFVLDVVIDHDRPS